MRSDGSPNSAPTAAEKNPEARIRKTMFTPGKIGGQLVARIGADPHEAAGAERDQAGIAGEDVEPDRREREDQHRDHHRGEREAATRVSGTTTIARSRIDRDADAILQQREDRLVRLVAGLELAGSRDRSIVLTLKTPLDDPLAEQALRPEQQEDERDHVGEPALDAACRAADPSRTRRSSRRRR